jgi:hypothetical protein
MIGPLLRVECYAGYKGGERPVRLFLHGKMTEIADVEDRWYSPGFTYFRVLMHTGERYVLRHQEAQDVWTLEAFRAGRCCIDTKINESV